MFSHKMFGLCEEIRVAFTDLLPRALADGVADAARLGCPGLGEVAQPQLIGREC
jgi:hypothetical protein